MTSLVKNFGSASQHGFMIGRSTTTNLTLYSSFLSNIIKNFIQFDVPYTDFSKVFVWSCCGRNFVYKVFRIQWKIVDCSNGLGHL